MWPLDRLFITYWPLSCLEFEAPEVSAQVLHQVNFSHLFSSIRLSFFLCLDSDDSLGCEMHVN